MPVKLSTVAKIAKAAQTRRNSQRGSVTRQNGNNSRSPKTHTSGRKRNTKVKKAKRSKRGSQKKRGRRASKRQRGGEVTLTSECTAIRNKIITDGNLIIDYKEAMNSDKFAASLATWLTGNGTTGVNLDSTVKDEMSFEKYIKSKIDSARPKRSVTDENKEKEFSDFMDSLLVGSLGSFVSCK